MSSTTTTTRVSPESRGQYKARAYAVASANSPLAPTMILRRDPGDDDVQIKILFCGICHTDLHQSVTSGARCGLSIHAFLDMRSLGVSPKSAPESPSSSPAILPQSAAWLTQTVTVTSARPALSSSAPT